MKGAIQIKFIIIIIINNIRIIGLPEDVEGPRPSLFFPGLLQELFGKELLVHPPECDRAQCFRYQTDEGTEPEGRHHPYPQVPGEGDDHPRG